MPTYWINPILLRSTSLIWAIVLLAASFPSTAANPNQFHKVNDSVYFIQGKARALQPNQALVIGKQCALLASLHGDLVTTEALIIELKKHLTVPLCYVVSLHSDIKQDTSIVLLKHAYPNLQWLSPTTISANALTTAFHSQLELFSQSIVLSENRIASLESTEQPKWQKKIALAKNRIATWSKLIMQAPSSKVIGNVPESVELGGLMVELTQVTGFSGHDISVYLPKYRGLIAGYSVDQIPLAHLPHTTQWQQTITRFNRYALDWILPATGKPYRPEMLTTPAQFLALLELQDSQQAVEKIGVLYPDKHMQQRALLQWQHFQQQRNFE
ncbi:hypothetical protein [Pseudoalteromonas piscicida]|uniref:Uncharacterized protein n=1 Tax=Pseudoalteromonas piscicida TaxID=43662 RepID=A0AAD0RIJ8_PSEO7|nr:hypothetical protein [Pseudoalteromonas piscicida]ASD68418.1 hypothetical protein B1L02_16290 [Pseudoalteromonas piscicida]AXQ96768.1 hypothetical protein D0N37_02515 [Pseudoalteromonas piscicida]AXR03467.1 hypothetical protein D0511_16345 [Pseudoalteromonas piscicida]